MERKESATYKAVRIDDTADWRLIIHISEDGMSAYLRHEEDPLEPIATLFELNWERDETLLLERIENVVYDHPQLLDDFSAEVIIRAPKTLWVPSEFLDEPGAEYELYQTVYEAEPEDIFIDDRLEEKCLYSLVTGLLSFLRRTLPGARIRSHLGVIVGKFHDRIADVPRIYVDMQGEEVDIIAFDGKRLLSSATYECHGLKDIAYHIFNVIEIEGIDPTQCQVYVSGSRERRNNLVKLLREHLSFVMLTMLPKAAVGLDLPLSVAIAAGRTRTSAEKSNGR